MKTKLDRRTAALILLASFAIVMAFSATPTVFAATPPSDPGHCAAVNMLNDPTMVATMSHLPDQGVDGMLTAVAATC